MIAEKLPPHEPEMEAAIIGCILQKPDLLDDCQARFKVGAEAFFVQSNRSIYSSFVILRREGIPIDSVTLIADLKGRNIFDGIGGIDYLTRCESNALTSNFEHYAAQVSQSYMLRKTIATCVEASNEVYNNRTDAEQVISNIENRLQSIREIRKSDLIVGGKTAARLLQEHLEQRFNLKGAKSGIITGIDRLDYLTDGLQFGEQTIVGARPSMGKTALATTIIRKACLIDKVPTLVITLEMSVHALCRRILSNHHRISMGNLRSGVFSEQDFAAFASFSNLLAKSPIHFIDAISGTDSNKICTGIKRMVKSHGIKLVVLDYLQKVKASGKHEKRTYEVAEVSSDLKASAVENNVAMLTLAQLNREPEKNKSNGKRTPPRLADLADSAQIERDGDTIGLLERDKTPGSTSANLLIAKQRDGEIGMVPLIFSGQYCSFEGDGSQQ